MGIILHVILRISIVPIRAVEVTTVNNPEFNQPLILHCGTTVVSGITNTFDIIWSTDNIQVRRVNNITAINDFNSSFVYNDSFIISSLNINEIESVYQCEVRINSILPTTAKIDFIIPIPGMCITSL